jgi:hypothetical protein
LIQYGAEYLHLSSFQMFFCLPGEFAPGLICFHDQDNSIAKLPQQGRIGFARKRNTS